MKKKRFFITTLAAAAGCAIVLGGCGATNGDYDVSEWFSMSVSESDGGDAANYVYDSIVEQEFQSAAETPSSYFSLDRNTAAYSLVRAQITRGNKIAYDSVRLEEMVNYFSYDYPAPEDGEEIRATTYLSDCPWNADHKLMTVGIRTQERVLQSERNNYVFLIDVSGSMSGSLSVRGENTLTKIDLVKYGVQTLVKNLTETDAVSVVTYASGVKCALEPTLCTEEGKTEILDAVTALTASGSTNGEGGLQLAYQTAQEYQTANGNNRVILMTDGDFNVGMSSTDELKEYISQKAESGIYLSVLGVGMGNLRDDLMQTLALNGNGNYAYLDTEAEAEKVLGEELNGMLVTVAKDAKAGVTFDADFVERYRILGYDMKIMTESEFNDSSTDAGEIGSNLCVTVMYEVELKEDAAEDAEIASAVIRYQSAESGEEKEITAAVYNTMTGGDDQAFAACVAEFALILRESEYKGTASMASLISRLSALSAYTANDAYKTEFVSLVNQANASEYYQ